MLEQDVSNVAGDFKTLVADAQELLHTAGTMTGEKADEMRERAMELLDSALENVQKAGDEAIGMGKKMAGTANQYVQEYPWRAITAGAAAGLVFGVLLGRR